MNKRRWLRNLLVRTAARGQGLVGYALILVTDEYPPFRLAP